MASNLLEEWNALKEELAAATKVARRVAQVESKSIPNKHHVPFHWYGAWFRKTVDRLRAD